MIIKYKILSVDEKEQSIVVRFYTDKISEESLKGRTDYNITLANIESRPKGVGLEAYILRWAPWSFFDMQEKVADPNVDTSMDDIKPFIGHERSREIDIIEGQMVLKPRT